MATDATGSPTPLGIPKFNTSVDAPSGLGGNAQMDSIDAAIQGRIAAPAGIAAGEVPVWNGSTWVRSSVTQVTASGIGSGVVKSPYRKTTSKQVVSSIAETDLLNGEITIGAGAMGTDRALRLTAWGDLINNSGAAQVAPRFKVKLGAATLLDTGTVGAGAWANNAGRFGWRAAVEILNLGATNAQWATLLAHLAGSWTATTGVFTTGEGIYSVATQQSVAQALGGGAGTVDTTVAQLLAFTVTNPANNAALDVTLKGALVEIL